MDLNQPSTPPSVGEAPAPKVRVVAFDFDGTLMRGQSGTIIVRYLGRHRITRRTTTALCAGWGVKYKLHIPVRQNAVREHIFRDLVAYTPEQFRRLMRRCHDEVMVERYKADGIAEVRRRVKEGDRVVLVSATFDEVAQAACEALGASAALATVMEVDEFGRFTGEVKGDTTASDAKYARIVEWADATFGAGGWVLAAAYGDHYTDIPMLEFAQEAYAVNPDRKLRKNAKKRGWPILEWS